MLECHLRKGRDHHGFGHHQHPQAPTTESNIPHAQYTLLTHWPGFRTLCPRVPPFADPTEGGQRIEVTM